MLCSSWKEPTICNKLITTVEIIIPNYFNKTKIILIHFYLVFLTSYFWCFLFQLLDRHSKIVRRRKKSTWQNFIFGNAPSIQRKEMVDLYFFIAINDNYVHDKDIFHLLHVNRFLFRSPKYDIIFRTFVKTLSCWAISFNFMIFVLFSKVNEFNAIQTSAIYTEFFTEFLLG